ncbi:hypothetical protein BDP27DRAFT_1320596 [Rhodocollybia butyracea]|uniref:Uncharacterized protein n=1 Tax=Rhodocollybia butyracea TaxID=206335 RepID=A0A9P5PZV7_9AGAR|nr:hypothetical protein BDP27DRAFT_1320596 [Rhodocollybia butyracea]
MASSPTQIENRASISYSHLQTSDDTPTSTPDRPSGASSPLPLHVGTKGTTMGYFTILSCYIGAGVVAVINHIVFSKLNGTLTGDHTKQFWVSLLQNVFPTAVALVLFTSLKACLSQAALHRLCSGTHSVGLVSLITSPPGLLATLKILAKSGLRRRILELVILSGLAQAIAVTSIFIPGSLTIVSSPAQLRLLEIPTIDLNAVAPTSSSVNKVDVIGVDLLPGGTNVQTLSFVSPSQRWTRLLGRSLLSSSAPTWDTPAGCEFSCNYSFSYTAPALNCTALSREDIWPNNNATSNSSLLQFPLFVEESFNGGNSSQPEPEFTYYLSSSGLPFSPTFDLYYIECFNLSNYDPRGVRCLFQNATYEATTVFSPTGQTSTTRVIEWHDSPDDSFPVVDNSTVLGATEVNVTMASLSIANVYAQMLNGSLAYIPEVALPPPIQAFNTPLFNLTSSFSVELNSDEVVLSLSSDINNLTDGLQGLFQNSTLALVGEGAATMFVNVTVAQDSLQYQYHPRKLGLIYGIVFGVALLVVIDGLICLRANGTAANFDFQGIVEMTAESRGLHESAVLPHFADVPVRGTLGISSGNNATRPVLNSDWELKKRATTGDTDN